MQYDTVLQLSFSPRSSICDWAQTDVLASSARLACKYCPSTHARRGFPVTSSLAHRRFPSPPAFSRKEITHIHRRYRTATAVPTLFPVVVKFSTPRPSHAHHKHMSTLSIVLPPRSTTLPSNACQKYDGRVAHRHLGPSAVAPTSVNGLHTDAAQNRRWIKEPKRVRGRLL